MKVLHVYRTYFPDTQGGLEEAIRQICYSTKQLGIQNSVFALSTDPNPSTIERPEATVIRAKRHAEIASCSISLTARSTFRKLCRNADVVHYHFPWPFADVLHFASRHGRPSVVTYHSDIVRQKALQVVYRPLQQHFLADVEKIVCTSPNYFATSDVLSKANGKVEVIPIGITESTYQQQIDSDYLEQAAQQFGKDFFLFVGVLRYYKGLHILLDAVKDAPYQVVIAGAGPTERELKLQAQRLNLTNVHFAGFIPDKLKVALFQLSRAIVFPSYLRSEAFGLTLLEGAMFHKPMISTEVGSGTSHVNVDGETGIVVPPGVAGPLRKAMDRLHACPGLAKQMGMNARLRYEQAFTGALMGRRYMRLYQDLGARSSTSA